MNQWLTCLRLAPITRDAIEMPYLFELPTTGSVSFYDLCLDPSSSFSSRLADATSARANVRGVLKDIKRASDERDYLQVVKVGHRAGRMLPLL